MEIGVKLRTDNLMGIEVKDEIRIKKEKEIELVNKIIVTNPIKIDEFKWDTTPWYGSVERLKEWVSTRA